MVSQLTRTQTTSSSSDSEVLVLSQGRVDALERDKKNDAEQEEATDAPDSMDVAGDTNKVEEEADISRCSLHTMMQEVGSDNGDIQELAEDIHEGSRTADLATPMCVVEAE